MYSNASDVFASEHVLLHASDVFASEHVLLHARGQMSSPMPVMYLPVSMYSNASEHVLLDLQ